MEADLQIYAGVDLRDYWRRDSEGRRLLSLRRIRVLVRALPPDSMTALARGGTGFQITDYILFDIYGAWAGKPHPADPRAKRVSGRPPDEALAAGKKRAMQRRKQLGITGSVLRKKK